MWPASGLLTFTRCVQDSTLLKLPHITDLIPVVGKFHLAAHVPRCFCKVQLELCPRRWTLDGEILETLWSEFKKVSQVCIP